MVIQLVCDLLEHESSYCIQFLLILCIDHNDLSGHKTNSSSEISLSSGKDSSGVINVEDAIAVLNEDEGLFYKLLIYRNLRNAKIILSL